MKREKILENLAVISIGFMVLYFLFKKFWLLDVSLAVLLIAVFIKPLAKLISRGWMKLAEGMGFVMSKVLLSIIFFLILTPIAFLQKITSKDNLRLKKEPGKSLYFEREGHEFTKEDLENPW
ncbi:MAG: hypothetical protein COA57_06760 [Flavobacteriales bacterium]|nr:MAG: hypothetical protein COA57_06760 [Flavobacteriales bacterium]